eukprot:CAMPEP_0202923782 /NCGR_PEP_ID=MMETSP1392-20130828/78630_1 /ASSEMBLY_ACC=CAM_ASM_000868 /TAXON_ID=225041 /ORGANISM="Chlamydomonas chlamydogama, Strain SAG 11-48b" /LENGTH=66 /DNA_ID=CAMNT_0049617481 /DNA_START=784 /DNA_END=984 /DNA_ORIENTATION=-
MSSLARASDMKADIQLKLGRACNFAIAYTSLASAGALLLVPKVPRAARCRPASQASLGLCPSLMSE